MATITIYGSPVSTYVRTVRLLLEEADANYNLTGINILAGENTSVQYLSKNPFGKIPTLEFDGELLYETAAITEYLDTVVANNKFSPSNPLSKARMRQIMAIIDSYLYNPAIKTIVIQRLIVPNQGSKTDEDAVKNAITPAKKSLEAIESLTVGSPYLLGSELSIADFYLIPIFNYLSKTPEFYAITAQTPKLTTWWNEANQLKNVKRVCR
ncbi:MAG: glutathione S-transferase family protein [Aulosira sp. ZfuVER01]|nr:glutathione S-transferase family protein [Aulosira sp. ZfuVER01]MDZ7999503.1 glutathione S-transferase family protein [Aulosira sp. DedVER01a]MDZ8054718.1 glutathione S-transferase family protein [Aulosira sp. ZfuCHP01]